MQNLMDYEALRVDVRARRARPVVRGSGSRSHAVRRRVGSWLVDVGSRLAEDDHGPLRTAADSS